MSATTSRPVWWKQVHTQAEQALPVDWESLASLTKRTRLSGLVFGDLSNAGYADRKMDAYKVGMAPGEHVFYRKPQPLSES